MTRNSLGLLIVALVTVCSGCASCGDTDAGNSNTNNVTVIVPERSENANTPFSSNGNTKMVPYNGAANLNGNSTLDNSKVTVVDTSKVKTENPARPAPENSEIVTEMNAKGHVIETRRFKDNPYLDRLVKTTVTPTQVSLKVYMKSGKVHDLPVDKLADFRIAAVSTILDAVGFKPPVKADPGAGKKEQ